MNKINRISLVCFIALIVILFIPLLFKTYSEGYKTENVYPGIITILWADTNNVRKKETFNHIYDHFPPLRNYIEINLTGNKKDDQVKLDFSSVRIREIISAEDSINGVNFNFGDSLEYGFMIEALKILN